MTELALMFVTISATFHLPQGLLSSVCWVESNHKTGAMNHQDGGSPSTGICQIKTATAVMLGYKGDADTLRHDDFLNIFYAGKYLGMQLMRYDRDVLKAVAAYNSGTHKVNAKGQTKNRKYVKKVLKAWKEGH